ALGALEVELLEVAEVDAGQAFGRRRRDRALALAVERGDVDDITGIDGIAAEDQAWPGDLVGRDAAAAHQPRHFAAGDVDLEQRVFTGVLCRDVEGGAIGRRL